MFKKTLFHGTCFHETQLIRCPDDDNISRNVGESNSCFLSIPLTLIKKSLELTGCYQRYKKIFCGTIIVDTLQSIIQLEL